MKPLFLIFFTLFFGSNTFTSHNLKVGATLQIAEVKTQPPPEGDMDSDGLPDEWERTGHGPIDLTKHNVSPGKADFFLVVVLRSGVTRAEINTDLDLAKQFYARMPNRNPDGSTGINMIVVDGNVLPESARGADYTSLYEAGLPVEWRGIGHGYLCDGRGGGGQTARTDWSSGGYDWQILSHELGHQFGLSHNAPGSEPSPLYTSLMNYDYSYSFGGDANAIKFSTGDFTSIRLNETNLSEHLNYSLDKLRFLEYPPYEFRLQSRSSSQTDVDWNRNGVFGETNIRADINDGAAVVLTHSPPALHLNYSAGAPSMTVVNSYLFLIYPVVTTNPLSWNTAKAEAPGGASLKCQRLTSTNKSAEDILVSGGVYSDPSASAFGNRLAVGFVTAGGVPVVRLWSTKNTGLNRASIPAFDMDQKVDQVVLAETSRKTWLANNDPVTGLDEKPSLWMFTWAADSKRIRATKVTDESAETDVLPKPHIEKDASYEIMNGTNPIKSDAPIAVAYNRITKKMTLVTNDNYGSNANHIKVITLKFSDNKWVFESRRWVGFENSTYTTNAAPAIIIDDSPSGGPTGMITLYVKGNVARDEPSQLYRLREISDRSYNDGWRVSMMENVWHSSRSAPCATLYGGNHVFAIRWWNYELDNRIVLYRDASGIIDEDLLDFDDVTHIVTKGLHESLGR